VKIHCVLIASARGGMARLSGVDETGMVGPPEVVANHRTNWF